MKINFDGTTKKATVSFSAFDRIINLLIVLVIVGAVLYGVFKPDLKSLIPPRPQVEKEEEVKFSEGNELSWQEYRSVIGDKKLMNKYCKQKSVVSGYLTTVPTKEKNQSYYYGIIIESKDTKDLTGFVVRFNYAKSAEKIKSGPITIMDDFDCGADYAYLMATDPVVVSN